MKLNPDTERFRSQYPIFNLGAGDRDEQQKGVPVDMVVTECNHHLRRRTQNLQLADNVSHVTMHGYLIEQGGRQFLQHILTDLRNIHIHRFSHRGGDTQALEVAVCEFNGLIHKINDMNRKLYIPIL